MFALKNSVYIVFIVSRMILLKSQDIVSPCPTTCAMKLRTSAESECQSWKSQFPRPDLYNLCLEGYEKGIVIGCRALCSPDTVIPNGDFCSPYRRDMHSACSKGYEVGYRLGKTSSSISDHLPVAQKDTVTSTTAGKPEGGADTKPNGKTDNKPEGKRRLSADDKQRLLNEAQKLAENAYKKEGL